jgi:hypothetical protein
MEAARWSGRRIGQGLVLGVEHRGVQHELQTGGPARDLRAVRAGQTAENGDYEPPDGLYEPERGLV